MRTFCFAITGLLFLPLLLRGQAEQEATRGFADTIGFAHLSWQMDSVMARIQRSQGKECRRTQQFAAKVSQQAWRTAICPHDDYAYVGYLYPGMMKYITAKTILLVGVCHKASQFGLENKIVLDDFTCWNAPYGKVKVSSLREDLKSQLPDDMFIVNREVHQAEHSLEALIPFIQYYNKSAEIVPILVPYMSFDRMKVIASTLARVLGRIAISKGWDWGRDFCILISTDAVHYGDEGWGEQSYARYGADSAGYEKAVAFDHEIAGKYLEGPITVDKIRGFSECLLSKEDHKTYLWTWCGRYSVPFGLLLSHDLENIMKVDQVGYFLCYSTSISKDPVRVSDLNMGTTAPASIRHWVGYAAIGYR